MNDTTPVDPAASTNPTGETKPINPTDAPQATAPLPAAEPKRLPARFGTIFWGVLLLTFAGFMIVNSVVPVVQDPVTWLIGGLIAAGAVLVIAGIAAAVRRTG